MAKMSFRYLMGLLEECHRFENMKFKNNFGVAAGRESSSGG